MTAGIGHNGGPDAIDEICAKYESARLVAESWADGAKVTNEAQMKEADAIRKDMRAWRLELEKGQKDATTPLHEAYKAEGARWKPTIEDAKRIEGCLVAAVDGYKRQLAAEKAEAGRKAREAEAKALRDAQEAAAASRDNSADLEAQRVAAQAAQDADNARIAAARAAKDTVKGMREVARHQVEDHRAALHWIAANDRDAVTAFIEEYARKNHREKQIAGVRVWQEREAY